MKQGEGVLITALTDEDGNPSENSPAAKAGIKAEDVIVGFGSSKIFSVQDLRMAVANTPPGQTVKATVVRFGKEVAFDVTVGERKFENREQEPGSYRFEEKKEETKPEIGLNFDNVPPRIAQEISVSGEPCHACRLRSHRVSRSAGRADAAGSVWRRVLGRMRGVGRSSGRERRLTSPGRTSMTRAGCLGTELF